MNPPNPPAFACPPVLDTGDDTLHAGHDGMTLRDYFAAAALARYPVDGATRDRPALWNSDAVAQWAYEDADAMLAERAKADTNPADGV